MADQDPPVGPLHRLDPTEPDEAQDLGQLEPLDPDAAEAPEAPAGGPPAHRARDGLGLAVALSLLLSLSSIAAIGGLVAISVGSLAPEPEAAVTGPIESAAAGPTIRVVESDTGPDSSRQDSRGDSGPEEEAPTQEAVAPPPAPAVAPPPAPSGGGKSTDEEPSGGKGGGRRPFGVGGAWCDAAAGSSCDVVVGGPVAQTVDEDADHASRKSDLDAEGFLPDEEEGEDLDGEGGHGKHGKHGKHD